MAPKGDDITFLVQLLVIAMREVMWRGLRIAVGDRVWYFGEHGTNGSLDRQARETL
jgi:hypothetical protein